MKYLREMKQNLSFIYRFLLFFGGCVTAASFAQNTEYTEKELIKHEIAVQKSIIKEKAIVSLDTLFYIGKPVCLFIEESKFLGSLLKGTLKNMNGTDAVWLRFITSQEAPNPQNLNYYEFYFAASGKRAMLPSTLGSSLEKSIVKNGLFVNGYLDVNAENKFVAQHPVPNFMTAIIVNNHPNASINTSGVTIIAGGNSGTGGYGNGNNGGYGGIGGSNNVNMANNSNYALVPRNRNAMVQVIGTNIQQDFKSVGNITKTTQAQNGTIVTTYTVSLLTGITVATATAQGATSHDYSILTMKDNRLHQVNSTIGRDEMDIAQHLINMGYL
jgi:hypothetical protein